MSLGESLQNSIYQLLTYIQTNKRDNQYRNLQQIKKVKNKD